MFSVAAWIVHNLLVFCLQDDGRLFHTRNSEAPVIFESVVCTWDDATADQSIVDGDYCGDGCCRQLSIK